MKYIYSAQFKAIEDGSGFYARVPDLPGCITTGKDISDAIEQITDAAGIWLVTAEDEYLEIPGPTEQSDLKKEADAIFSLIQIDTLEYRAKTDTHAVRKNVSIPAWMSALADKRKINCSKVLQNGLLAEFRKTEA
jgi:predicted RNase H-like HicB family nuclease